LLHLFEIELIRFEGNNRVVVPNRPIDIKNFFLFIVFNYCQRFVYGAYPEGYALYTVLGAVFILF